MRPRSRGADSTRGLHQLHPPSQTEGAGKAGCRLHPRSCTKSARVTTGSTGSLRLSLRNGLRLIRTLPGDRAFLPPSPSGLTMHPRPGWAGCISAGLDASVGASGPRFRRPRLSRQRSCRTSCDPASSGEDGWQRRSSARRPIAHGKPALRPLARPTLSRPSHPVPRL
jgi:hypothetical protein